METRITNYIKSHLAGDYQIWFIVFLLNTFGLLIQFSAKGKLNMSGPFDPITNMLKSMVILGLSFFLMSWFSRQNYIKMTQFSHVALIFSWILIGIALKFGESKGGASRWIEWVCSCASPRCESNQSLHDLMKRVLPLESDAGAIGVTAWVSRYFTPQ